LRARQGEEEGNEGDAPQHFVDRPPPIASGKTEQRQSGIRESATPPTPCHPSPKDSDKKSEPTVSENEPFVHRRRTATKHSTVVVRFGQASPHR
jgi:hypothetical protein